MHDLLPAIFWAAVWAFSARGLLGTAVNIDEILFDGPFWHWEREDERFLVFAKLIAELVVFVIVLVCLLRNALIAFVSFVFPVLRHW